MKEVLLGSEDDRRFISGYLSLMRSIKPIEMFLSNNVRTLAEMRTARDSCLDFGLLDDILGFSTACLATEYSGEFELVPEDRYYVAVPEGDDRGGFHSRDAVGYQNIFRAACTVVLNSRIFPDATLRTIEFARNYLHDSVHHSTFCTFRLLRHRPSKPSDTKNLLPEVSREQYGINFRNAKGESYSSVKLTQRVPQAINLNVLMDGVGVEISAEMLNRLDVAKRVRSQRKKDRLVLDETLLRIKRSNPTKWGEDFFYEVVLPTRTFVEHWGGDAFSKLIFRAMLDGALEELKEYFAQKHGARNAWEKVFRQPGFRLDSEE